MLLNRREFLKKAGGATVAAVSPISLLSFQSKKVPVAIFFEETFPQSDIPISRSLLLEAFPNDQFEVAFLNADQLKTRLSSSSFRVFINPYGSLFPKESFETVERYLVNGGNWLNLGGTPFSVPVTRTGKSWKSETRQTNYHKKLGITQFFPIRSQKVNSYQPNPKVPGAGAFSDKFSPDETYELYVRFANTRDFPEEDGSAGQRDAILTPVVWGLSSDKTRITAPVVVIDRLLGPFAGGRWVLANFKGRLHPAAIRTMTEIALTSSIEFTVIPTFACCRQGELPVFSLRLRRPGAANAELYGPQVRIEVKNVEGKRVSEATAALHGRGELMTGEARLPAADGNKLPPGFYRVMGRLTPDSNARSLFPTSYETGFWIYDESLLAGGKPVSSDSHWLLREGKPFPVTGTTYMTSDVHRKFLFEPNPALWDSDFAAMKAAGVNMVRTGIWTAWRNYMPDVGRMNETTLRSLDAFLLTARKYDIPVIFTFFAFLPEMWGGENPYLDPRSVQAQREFVGIIARRYRMMDDLIWDFINEPSFCSPMQLWSTRPNYDRHEVQAWNEWLKKKYPDPGKLQEMWRLTSGEAAGLPKLDEFSDTNIFYERRPLRVLDYRLFAQDMFNAWVEEMKKAIRSNGNKHQLVTVGQDEGGTYERPGPQFYASVVDFTCLHNWWANDDLLWDSIVTKSPLKPNLVEETGVMFYEKIDGSAWRSEEDARNLLERKLAYSMGANGAGFIQWIWNTNIYMPSDNEAAIGFHRADGTAKPELESFLLYARFFSQFGTLMTGKQDEDVVMIIPHAQMFSVRNYATEATKKCVRIMHEGCSTALRAVSEFTLDTMKETPKLLIVPSAQCLSDTAWENLLRKAYAGATLLVSGVVDRNEYWMHAARLRKFGITSETRPVGEEEFLSIGGKEYWLEFRSEKMEKVEKAVLQSGKVEVAVLQSGRGKLVWSPLPVELGEPFEAVAALYRYALDQAKIGPVFHVERNTGSVLIRPTLFGDVILYTFVSEADRNSEVSLQDVETKAQVSVMVKGQRTAMVLLRRGTGEIIGRLG